MSVKRKPQNLKSGLIDNFLHHNVGVLDEEMIKTIPTLVLPRSGAELRSWVSSQLYSELLSESEINSDLSTPLRRDKDI